MRAVIVLILIATACSSAPATDAAAVEERPSIAIPLSLYVLVEAQSGDLSEPDFSSVRTVAEVEEIAARMNDLWAPAQIMFDPIRVQELEVPRSVLTGVGLGDSTQFFAELNRTFTVPDQGAINGFYVQVAFGVNGFTPQGSRAFFVVDEPSVNDERVSSHEVGHILGLHHATDDATRLMFSGTNGTALTDTEQLVARYGAAGLVGAR